MVELPQAPLHRFKIFRMEKVNWEWWWDIDPPLFWSTLILLSLGIVMVFSASMTTGLDLFADPFFFLKRHLVGLGVSLPFFVAASVFNLELLRRLSRKLLVFSFILLILVFVPGIGREVGGAYRWLAIGFQPSELAKLSVILYMADALVHYRDRAQDFIYGVVPFLLVVGGTCLLVLLAPSLGTALFLVIIAFLMLYLGGRRIFHLLLPVIIIIPTVFFLVFFSGNVYWRARVESFLNPEKDPLGKGFQIIQSLIALGSGGIFGLGLGESRQKFFYLPERHTDFIFAIIGEEFGFVGTLSILVLFGVILWRGWRIAVQTQNEFEGLLAMGLTLSIFVQATINLSVVLKIIPITGITLPLMSYGNSSLLITLIKIGILFNIASRKKGNVG
ncbi:MAG TPA: putative lipid II flippase FtsW [Atribacteraceae bacterium]|nr:putative lipid II flippase FtsW [Atribacteraceae bacterium]